MVPFRWLGLDRLGGLGKGGFDSGLDLGSWRRRLGRVHGGVTFLYRRRGVQCVCRILGLACGQRWRLGIRDFDVVDEYVGVVYRRGQLVACPHVVVDEKGEMMGAWGDGDVGRKGIWVRAGATTSSDMSVSVCGVTVDRRRMRSASRILVRML